MVRQSKIALVVGSVALVVVALVAVMMVDRPAEIFEPGSVEAAAQAYSAPVLNGNRHAAWAMLTPRYQGDLTRRCRNGPLPGDRPTNLRVSLLDVNVDNDNATMQVRITESFTEGPFGLPSEYSHEDRFDLASEGGAWLIDLAPGWGW